jgi:hypothetical protein
MPARGAAISSSTTLRTVPWLRATVVRARGVRANSMDALLKIRTFPNFAATRVASETVLGVAHGFARLDYVLVRRFMRPLTLKSEDMVMDIGCGTGRTLCMFARHPIRRCIGVECDAALAQIASKNAHSLRGRRCRKDILITDASDADYSEPTIFWLYDPFGEKTMRRVAGRIGQSFKKHPRPVRIVFATAIENTCEPEFTLFIGRVRSGSVLAPTFGAGRAIYWRDPRMHL